MKKGKFKIILLICLVVYFGISYFNATREITILKTDKEVGDKISLIIEADQLDEHIVWIDLNNNGKKDADEKITKFGSILLHHNFSSFTVQSKTITLHGKIRGLYCGENQIVSLDVSKAKSLKFLDCSRNRLANLDVSRCTNLRFLYCYFNDIKHEAMSNLINSLPQCKEKDKGEFILQCLDKEEQDLHDGNEYLPESIKKAKAKNWRVWRRDYAGERRWQRKRTEL